ncbi:enoyl-CoA hydratase/isomerase family protein [Hazenella sp. IB182353]|uniref:enoyl-CoA hydratase/isomerase family protein n=1 Tax=Polycladospora coralii TaxID=2771432 RepID=UPI0017472336|nr:enoyl-CoA hydratase/isomerase family protein [Polycladospora coralii]MBS7530261.1 enoyl-CoA hydratase/isomerase family protein [Polycladospora coralii]
MFIMNTLITHKKDGIGWIQFHRPAVRNAVNQEMMAELEHVITEWEQDETLQVVVLYGDEKAFVSGGDVEAFHQIHTKEEIYPVMKRMGDLLQRISELKCITIAAVEGIAVGGGCEVVTSCDFCLASKKAKFGMIQSRIAITTGWGGASRLMNKIGKPNALKMLITGEVIDVERAKEMQLVDEVIESSHFLEEVQVFAQQFVLPSPMIGRAYKEVALALEQGTPLSAFAKIEATNCADCWEAEEHVQAVERFLAKRNKVD